jgi:hypothetical protein
MGMTAQMFLITAKISFSCRWQNIGVAWWNMLEALR